MTPEHSRPINQRKVQAVLRRAAGGCGGVLNSVLAILGEKFGLYKTEQYSFDLEE